MKRRQIHDCNRPPPTAVMWEVIASHLQAIHFRTYTVTLHSKKSTKCDEEAVGEEQERKKRTKCEQWGRIHVAPSTNMHQGRLALL